MAKHEAAVQAALSDAELMLRVSKRLCYLLRHSQTDALFWQDGWTSIAELPRISRAEAHAAVQTSLSIRFKGEPRFELLDHPVHGELIRARHWHSWDVSAATALGSARVPSLLNLCVSSVCDHIKMFANLGDAEPGIVGRLVSAAKARNLLTTAVIKSFATPNVDSLDFGSCRLTPGNLEFIAKRCASLSELSLSGCTALNDQFLGMLASRCKLLRHLDLSDCRSFSQRGLEQLVRLAPQLQSLSLSGVSEDLDFACLQALPECDVDYGAPLIWAKQHTANPGTFETMEEVPGIFLESATDRGELVEFRQGSKVPWRRHRIASSTGFGRNRSVLLESVASDGRRFWNVLRPHRGEFAGQRDEQPSLHEHHRPWVDGHPGKWMRAGHYKTVVHKLGYPV